MPTLTARRQEEAFAEILKFLKIKFSKDLGSSLTTRIVYGCIDHDEGAPEQYAIKVITALGEQLSGSVRLISDAQSGWLDEEPCPTTSGAESCGRENAFSSSNLWIQLRDDTASVQHRLEAFHKLLPSERDNTIAYVANELASEDASEEWVSALVFLAEDVHFPSEHRITVRDSLLRIARLFRSSTKAGAERIVWSAIRRASSLLTSAEANLLVPFLERDGIADARAVTLKCVENLFLSGPPVDVQSVLSIGDRANTLAEKFLDPDIFEGGEPALLAQNAVCTLAAIGDERISGIVTRAAKLNRRWLKHQLRTRLDRLRTSWESKGQEVTSGRAFRNLVAQLPKLV